MASTAPAPICADMFDPADVACWLGRGRPLAHAECLAGIWRQFPDLPPAAPLEDRMTRGRERIRAMRALMDEIAREQEALRQSRNFASVEASIANGDAGARDHDIVRGRDMHGHGWDEAIRYADGRYAARAGWHYEPPSRSRAEAAAYDLGFRESGGDPDDLFDAARRQLRAEGIPASPTTPVTAKPRPSSWLKPTDAPRPTPWPRRLIIFGAAEAGIAPAVPHRPLLLPRLAARAGATEAIVLVVAGDRLATIDTAPAPADLPAFLAGRNFDDVLVAAQDEDLAVIDAHAGTLPLTRNQERLRNSALQQHAQFSLWLDRGLRPGEVIAAGHVRWRKAFHSLHASLGELTATYAGKSPAGHAIAIAMACTGAPATGYHAADGSPLVPTVIVSNRKAVRRAMTAALRRFAAATRLP